MEVCREGWHRPDTTGWLRLPAPTGMARKVWTGASGALLRFLRLVASVRVLKVRFDRFLYLLQNRPGRASPDTNKKIFLSVVENASWYCRSIWLWQNIGAMRRLTSTLPSKTAVSRTRKAEYSVEELQQ